MTSQLTLTEHLKKNKTIISNWLAEKEADGLMPFYTSVDVRDSGFKIAAVDTNLFPAGFNNLCQPHDPRVLAALKTTILKRVPNCKSILFISEEHTRNGWYLENVRILNRMIQEAGFQVKTASFLTEDTVPCTETNSIELETATGHKIQVFCLHNILNKVAEEHHLYDLIILNNDLTEGIPKILKETNIPIYPSIQAGWHSRLKSHHFTKANQLIEELGKLIDIDPWLMSCLFKTSQDVDINDEADRQHLFKLATDLFNEIQQKYNEHHITEKPLIFLKADQGTYGMGVMPIESPEEILTLNRKDRNKLHKGKGSKLIEKFILQEGVPSISEIDHKASETCIYQIANEFVGGFYRVNSEKNGRENLNSKGMSFETICLPSKLQECEGKYEKNIDLYQILARIAGIAAQKEIHELENSGILANEKV